MSQDFRSTFHVLIIAQILFLLFLAIFSTGCGFKDDPFRAKQNTQESAGQ